MSNDNIGILHDTNMCVSNEDISQSTPDIHTMIERTPRRSRQLPKLDKELGNLCHVYGKDLSNVKSKLADKERECLKLKVENISAREYVASLNKAVKAR